MNDTRELSFGKFKGYTFGNVLLTDPQYCRRLLFVYEERLVTLGHYVNGSAIPPNDLRILGDINFLRMAKPFAEFLMEHRSQLDNRSFFPKKKIPVCRCQTTNVEIDSSEVQSDPESSCMKGRN